MENKAKYYVYVLKYPESMGGAVFYVGKGCKHRTHGHESQTRMGGQSEKCDVIRKIWASGEEVAKEKVAFFEDQQDAFIYEWVLINLIYGLENLTNYQGGGSGKHSKMPKMARKSVSFILDINLMETIWTQENNLSRFFREDMMYYLQNKDMIDYFANNTNTIQDTKRSSRRQYIFSVYLDTYDLVQEIPKTIRSAFVEYCLRKHYGFPLDN